MTTPTLLTPTDIVVTRSGTGIGGRDVAHARKSVARAAAHTHEPLLSARVQLIHYRKAGLRDPYLAHANLDVNGRVVHAHFAATSMGAAIDGLSDRIRGQVQRLARFRDHRPAGPPTPARSPGLQATTGERHGAGPARPPRVVRHSAYELPRATVDEAAWDMDLMDYDFHLFVEASSGQDSVIYHGGPTGYRIAQVAPKPGWQARAVLPVTASTKPAARMTLPDALDHLEATGRPFLFYAVASGRGRLVYRRHDGDYGLIVPPDQ